MWQVHLTQTLTDKAPSSLQECLRKGYFRLIGVWLPLTQFTLGVQKTPAFVSGMWFFLPAIISLLVCYTDSSSHNLEPFSFPCAGQKSSNSRRQMLSSLWVVPWHFFLSPPLFLMVRKRSVLFEEILFQKQPFSLLLPSLTLFEKKIMVRITKLFLTTFFYKSCISALSPTFWGTSAFITFVP